MTIGFLLNTCEPFYRGGYERRAWAFARELARRGHDVRIYTSCERDQVIDGVRFVLLAKPRKFFNARGVRNGSADLFFAIATLKLLFKLKRGELEVLDICATPFLHLPFAAFVAKVKCIPAVLTCHEALLAALPDYVRERGQKGGSRARILLSMLRAIYCLGMRLFPRRIAVSDRTSQALEREGFPAKSVVEFGLEPEAIASSPPQPRGAGHPVRLIYSGRLTPIKSVGSVLEALVRLRGETAAFHFDIVGEGGERPRLEDQARELPGLVTFHGDVSEERKRELLAAADVFVLGSPREGFSIATLEGMAQGCAALVVNDPAHPNGVLDFVRNGQEGLVVSPGAGEISAGLKKLIENPHEREEYRRAAHATARFYKIEGQAERLQQAYRAKG